jgi:hypothetical protein
MVSDEEKSFITLTPVVDLIKYPKILDYDTTGEICAHGQKPLLTKK